MASAHRPLSEALGALALAGVGPEGDPSRHTFVQVADALKAKTSFGKLVALASAGDKSKLVTGKPNETDPVTRKCEEADRLVMPKALERLVTIGDLKRQIKKLGIHLDLWTFDCGLFDLPTELRRGALDDLAKILAMVNPEARKPPQERPEGLLVQRSNFIDNFLSQEDMRLTIEREDDDFDAQEMGVSVAIDKNIAALKSKLEPSSTLTQAQDAARAKKDGRDAQLHEAGMRMYSETSRMARKAGNAYGALHASTAAITAVAVQEGKAGLALGLCAQTVENVRNAPSTSAAPRPLPAVPAPDKKRAAVAPSTPPPSKHPKAAADPRAPKAKAVPKQPKQPKVVKLTKAAQDALDMVCADLEGRYVKTLENGYPYWGKVVMDDPTDDPDVRFGVVYDDGDISDMSITQLIKVLQPPSFVWPSGIVPVTIVRDDYPHLKPPKLTREAWNDDAGIPVVGRLVRKRYKQGPFWGVVEATIVGGGRGAGDTYRVRFSDNQPLTVDQKELLEILLPVETMWPDCQAKVVLMPGDGDQALAPVSKGARTV